VLGLASVVALFVNDGLDVDGLPGGARLAGVILLGVCLAVGLQVRAKEPSESMVLLVVGSFAPTAAWYNLPPAYILTVAIAGLALFTTPHPPKARRVSLTSLAPVHGRGAKDPLRQHLN
jgi:hypothetical protein